MTLHTWLTWFRGWFRLYFPEPRRRRPIMHIRPDITPLSNAWVREHLRRGD